MQPNHKTDFTHNKHAPYWAALLSKLWTVGISTIMIDWGNFLKGYVLDMVGPAWNYILFRGLFTAKADNLWTRVFTPTGTVLLFLSVCILIETLQYFRIYSATYDPWDFAAYFSLLIPLYILDLLQSRKDGNAYNKTK